MNFEPMFEYLFFTDLSTRKFVVRFSKPLLRGHYYRKTSAQAPDFRYEEYVKLVIILNFVRKSGNCLLEPVDMLEMMKA